jgi:hypothetical protein
LESASQAHFRQQYLPAFSKTAANQALSADFARLILSWSRPQGVHLLDRHPREGLQRVIEGTQFQVIIRLRFLLKIIGLSPRAK